MTERVMVNQSQEFCVRWNSHLGSLGAAFPQLLAGQRFVDVTLVCEGHQLHCHRLVLAACSSYFESILAENPCKHPVIILPQDIKLWEIQAIVDFMYKGEVNVTQAGLTNLLKCAESLQIRGLFGSDAALNLNQLQQMSKNTPANSAGNAGPIAVSENVGENQSVDDDTSSSASSAAASTSAKQTSEEITSTPIALTPTTSGQIKILSSISSTPQLHYKGDTTNDSIDETSYEHFESFSKSEHDDSNAYGQDNESGDNDDGLQATHSSFKRVRRSEALLTQAAKCVSKGQTFQTVSNMFNIPVSTIRFFMARKGILPKRKRGRGSSVSTFSGSVMTNALSQAKRTVSPTEPPYQFVGYKLPAQKPNLM